MFSFGFANIITDCLNQISNGYTYGKNVGRIHFMHTLYYYECQLLEKAGMNEVHFIPHATATFWWVTNDYTNLIKLNMQSGREGGRGGYLM